MATPIYRGGGQPPANCGGWFGSWLNGTPAYHDVGQPTQRAAVIGGSQPVYQTGPSAELSSQGSACGPIAIVIPRQLMEPQS